MKNCIMAMVLLGFCFGCNSNTTTNKNKSQNLSDIELMAKAYGFDTFKKINQLQYTFNVSRNDTLLVARKWIWNKESDEITLINNQDTTNYRQTNITDDLKKIDHRFINDKYWLLFPFQLVGDEDVTITNLGTQLAPISHKEFTKLTVQYGNDVGYTPGDAYDLYLDGDWIIREWEFRKSGKEPPGSAITWEGYKDYNGIKIATDHINEKIGLRIYFTDITVE